MMVRWMNRIGKDLLSSANGDDILRGGPGVDRGNAFREFRSDVCVHIEKAHGCEVTR